MDPNVALENCRKALQVLLRYNGAPASTVNELVESFGALDRWLSAGGFLPGDWAALS
jgi:hypothetical protein